MIISFFTKEQTEDREVKQLNQGHTALKGMGRTEFPVSTFLTLLCIVAHSIIMMKLTVMFISTFKDLPALLYLLTHSIITVILEVHTRSFLFYRREK